MFFANLADSDLQLFRFHSFLLDKEGHPVFVGNPLASDRMMELFKEALESLE